MKKWTSVFNQFDPWRPISGAELETWFVERQDSPLSRLELRLQPDRVEHKILLVGQRGCGKTSELLKLVSRMWKDYFTLYIDLFGSLDLTTASRLELLFCIGAAAYKAMSEVELAPPEDLWQELVASLSTLIRQETDRFDFKLESAAILSTVACTTEAVYPAAGQFQRQRVVLRQTLEARFSESELRTLCFDLAVDYDGLPGAGKTDKARELVSYIERHGRMGELLEGVRRQRPDIHWENASRAGVKAPAEQNIRFGLGLSRQTVERLELDPILREVIARVNAIISEVERRTGKPMLLIADGLDKISDLEKAQLIFGRSWVLTAIECRALYTVPTVLYYSTLFRDTQHYFDSEELPNVRLYHKGRRGEPDIAGQDVMHSLIEKRLRSADLSREDVFTSEALEKLIQISGGMMRDMVRVVRHAVVEAELMDKEVIDMQAAQRAIDRLRREMQAPLFEEHYRALAEIERSGGFIDGEDKTQMELLRDGYVLSYHDGFWRDVHPVLWSVLADYRAQLSLQC
jgi:hypothetical protein